MFNVRLITYFLLVFPCFVLSAEENFLLTNGREKVLEVGNSIHERITPCSTFKIALSLMGFDTKGLKDEFTPTWSFQKGYDDYLECWKTPQTPETWIKNSCVWYSKKLTTQLGLETIQHYLALLDYGNLDISGGLTKAWQSSSLKISLKEQVDFIQRTIQKKLPISNHAYQMTKTLLYIETLPRGWKLYGKTGWSGPRNNQDESNLEIGWFVGWIEKNNHFFPFAYNIWERRINLAQRIPRVKQLLANSNVMTEVFDE